MKMSKKLLKLDPWEQEKVNWETKDIPKELDLWLSTPMKTLNSSKPSEMYQESMSLTLIDLILDN